MDLKEIRQEIQEKIEEADMILVGIGSELDTDREMRERNQKISEKEIRERILGEAEEKQEESCEEFFERCFSVYQKKQGKKQNSALLHLKEILNGKNYFVISTNADECLQESGFRYLVTPCGREALFQCSQNCSNSVWENEEYLKGLFLEWESKSCLEDIYEKKEGIQSWIASLKKTRELFPRCPVCNARADFNIITGKKEQYCEQGYLSEWEKYMKWLSGTLNKKLLLLELGCDFSYPQIIRWAFERTALLNQKAFLVRVHHSLSNIPEEIRERSSAFAVDSRKLFWK